MSAGAGKLIGVGVGPGDPELITLKAIRALSEVGRMEINALPKSCIDDRICMGATMAQLGYELVASPAAANPALHHSASTNR